MPALYIPTPLIQSSIHPSAGHADPSINTVQQKPKLMIWPPTNHHSDNEQKPTASSLLHQHTWAIQVHSSKHRSASQHRALTDCRSSIHHPCHVATVNTCTSSTWKHSTLALFSPPPDGSFGVYESVSALPWGLLSIEEVQVSRLWVLILATM